METGSILETKMAIMEINDGFGSCDVISRK